MGILTRDQAAYGNEAEVGAGIKASGVARKDFWLTTKLDNPDHHRVVEALDESLQKLGIDYVDLYLMHWPSSTDPNEHSKHLPDRDFIKTWAEMQELVETGKVRNIGVSNFAIKNLEKLLNSPTTKVSHHCFNSFYCILFDANRNQITPAVNQVELHPNNPSPKLVAYNTSKGIHSTAYSCLGSTDSPLYKNQMLVSIAESKGKTPQQCLLVWGLKHGWSVIPKSITPSRIEANFQIDGWDLSDEEMKKIDGMTERFKVCKGDFLPKGVQVFFGDDEDGGRGFVQPVEAAA